MGGQENELSLEGMTRKLEALTERLGRLERENAGLRQEVAALRGSGKNGAAGVVEEEAAPGTVEGRVSRGWLLRNAAAAAVGVVAAGALSQSDIREAKAAADAKFRFVDCKALGANHGSRGIGVEGRGTIGVKGTSLIEGEPGVFGGYFRSEDPAVVELGDGVMGVGRGNDYAGVIGINTTGTGVRGESRETGYCGVVGEHLGSLGYGVCGIGKGNGAGVLGRNSAGSGYAGQFEGGKAQLWLKPATTAGAPTDGSHQKGEVYMGSNANLFVCTQSGTPGMWSEVRFVST